MSATLLRRSLVALIFSISLSAQTAPPDFNKEVQPLLNSCLTCHSSQLATSGLALDSRESLLKGGSRGAAVTPGHPEQSLLIEAVKRTGELKMPPGRALDSQQVAVLERWIQAGAAWGEKADAGDGKPWAFRVPQRPEPPSVTRSDWAKNPIDRFILAKLEAKDIAPAAEADKNALLRRVSLDLTGLLPSPQEIAAFVADDSPNAYEKVVDRLLASDHYGERWGRHWLDLARYADSDGYSIDGPRPIWPYRDWVVNAINEDKPFNEFVIEQIAGDLLPNPTKDQLIATGFNRNTPLNFEGGIDQEQYRIEAVADRVATTGSVFMGLTIGCARCHDHKYDPLKQKEFYQLFAFYNNTVEISTLDDRYKFYEPMLDLRTPKEDAEAKAYWAQVDALSAELAHYIQELQAKPRQANDPPMHKDEGLRARMATLRDIMRPVGVGASYRWKKPIVTQTLITRERQGDPRETFVHIGGDFLRHGEKVEPGVPAALSAKPVTGNRLDLAKWLVSRDNPLTARVTLNRMWQRYFGKGIVETENDFGAMGNPPTHPELLDWLAVEFMESGWSQKAMHRLIVTSATYRQSSANRPELEEVDPYNNLLARQARIRLDAEIVRDAALSASGLLAPELGGPGVYPPIPAGAMAATQITRAWPTSTGPDRYRRGLYTVFFRQSPPPSLVLFDAPNAAETCTRRVRSNSPLQALTLLNDQSFLEFAIALGKRTMEEAPADTDRARLDYAFLLALNRAPLAAERDRLSTYLAKERAEYQAQPAKALELVATLAEGSGADDAPEFTLAEAPELAAWTSIGRVLLNLDDFMTRE
jgi:hypothetical protein